MSLSLQTLLLVQWTPVLITHFTHSGVTAHGKGFKSATPGDRHHYISGAVIPVLQNSATLETDSHSEVPEGERPAYPIAGHNIGMNRENKRVIRNWCWKLKFSTIFSGSVIFLTFMLITFFPISHCIPIPDPAKLVSMWEMSNNLILLTLWFACAIYAPTVMLELKCQGQYSFLSLI